MLFVQNTAYKSYSAKNFAEKFKNKVADNFVEKYVKILLRKEALQHFCNTPTDRILSFWGFSVRFTNKVRFCLKVTYTRLRYLRNVARIFDKNLPKNFAENFTHIITKSFANEIAKSFAESFVKNFSNKIAENFIVGF